MKLAFLLLPLIAITSFGAFADTQCGPFRLSAKISNGPEDGFMRINGRKPDTQKVTPLKAKDDYDNVKIQWMLESDTPGIWYGMDYIKRNGKAILNVQLVQASMDAPKIYGTYDCVKMK